MNPFQHNLEAFQRHQQNLSVERMQDIFAQYRADGGLDIAQLDFAGDLLPSHAPSMTPDAWPNVGEGMPPSLPMLITDDMGEFVSNHTFVCPDMPRSAALPAMDGKWKMDPVFDMPQARDYDTGATLNSHPSPSFPDQQSRTSANADSIPDVHIAQQCSNDWDPISNAVLPMELPNFEPPRPSRSNARAERYDREREKADKLKEKNKRAQRKFRQRQKDKQEHAEKKAVDLGNELKRVLKEKDDLEQRNKQLECTLQQVRVQAAPKPPSEDPVFTPAKGWAKYHPQKGMVLIATINGPLKLSHEQLMSLSLKDVQKILGESVRRMKDAFAEYDRHPPVPEIKAEASKKIEMLMNERHAIVSYMAVNKQQALYQIICSRMSNPPIEEAPTEDLEFWEKIMEDIEITPKQLENILEARRTYIRKMDTLLEEREQLKRELANLPTCADPQAVTKIPLLHLQWAQLIDCFKLHLDVFHRCNAYFMARLWYSDCLEPLQAARIICRAFPTMVNPFAVTRTITKRVGVPNHVETMIEERLKLDDRPNSLDAYVETFPPARRDGTSSTKLESEHSSEAALPEIYSAAHGALDSTSSHETTYREHSPS